MPTRRAPGPREQRGLRERSEAAGLGAICIAAVSVLARPLAAQDGSPVPASPPRAPAFEPTNRFNPRITPEVLVVQSAAPAVVFVVAQRPTLAGWDLLGKPVTKLQPVSGSGVVVDKTGFIVTNYHILGPDARSIDVTFDPEIDQKSYPAALVSFVASEDLALLKIRGERDFPVVHRGTSSDLMIGERVVAIGNPLKQRLSVSTGIIPACTATWKSGRVR